MQPAASNGIAHVAAQLAVGRAGVHVGTAFPITQRIDFGAGIHAQDVFGSGVALTDNQAAIIQQVLAIAAIFFVKPSGDTAELFLLNRHGRALEDAVVAAAQAVGLIRREDAVLGHLPEVHVDVTSNAAHSVDHIMFRNRNRGLRDDGAYLMADLHFHSDARVADGFIREVDNRSSNAIRLFIRMRGIHFFVHSVLLSVISA